MEEAGDLSTGGPENGRPAVAARRALAASLTVVAALLAWQSLTVRFNYGGNWTALFQMGELKLLPDELRRGAYTWRNHRGYEGEESRVVAHDPLNARGWATYLEDPESRYTRWLMPALAHAIGLGRTEWIDRGCVVAFLLFAGVGTFALVLEFGWAGLAFAFLPSTLIAMDRMTINVSLAALTAVALVARRRRAWTWFWPAVALAPVAHPQGWVLPVAAFLVCMRWKDWRGMVLATASLVPGLVLLTSVQRFLGQNRLVIDAIMDWLAPWSLLASIEALWTKVATAWTHEWRGPLLALMHWLDNAALLAIGLVAIWTVWRFKARTGRWERWALFLLVVPGSLVDAEHHLAEPFMWLNYATPLVLLHWADTPRDWRIVRWAPLAICSLRTLYQFGFQVLGVLRGLTGG